MKTIAVDEGTWVKLKILREKLQAKSYDEVIQLLIEAWKNTELDKALTDAQIPDSRIQDIRSLLEDKRKGRQGR